MKKYKKEFVPCIQRREDVEENRWQNAKMVAENHLCSPFSMSKKRVCSTFEEAKMYIDWCVDYFQADKRSGRHVMRAGMIGVVCDIDREFALTQEVVKTKIKVREVTEWEEIKL